MLRLQCWLGGSNFIVKFLSSLLLKINSFMIVTNLLCAETKFFKVFRCFKKFIQLTKCNTFFRMVSNIIKKTISIFLGKKLE